MTLGNSFYNWTNEQINRLKEIHTYLYNVINEVDIGLSKPYQMNKALGLVEYLLEEFNDQVEILKEE